MHCNQAAHMQLSPVHANPVETAVNNATEPFAEQTDERNPDLM
jgi:hypothetical protein